MNFFTKVRYFIYVWKDIYSDTTKSYEVKKKFSEVADYVRSKDFLGHSKIGLAKRDTDVGNTWIYEYDCAGGQGGNATRFKVTIQHYKDTIISMEVFLHSNLPQYELDKAMNKLQKTLPDYEGKVEKIPQAEKEDYSKYSFAELADKFDKATAAFGNQPCAETFEPMLEIRKAIGNLIDAKPITERGKYAGPLKNIDMYISTIKTQLSNPATADLISQFSDNYVSQIRGSIGELAGLI